QQRMQLVDVLRQELVPLGREALREVPLRAQQARLEKCDEVEQLVEIVLNGRGRQQENKLLLQLAGELPCRRRAIAQVVQLVDDHHVPPASEDGGTVRLALGRVD